MITKLDQMFAVLQGKTKKKIVAVWANDNHTICAVSDAIDKGIVEGILVGDKKEIEKTCKQENINISKFTIVEANSDVQAANIGVKMVAEKQGDILMKGLISTDKYMRAILNKEVGLLPPKGVLSHVTVIENPNYHKLMIVADVAVIPAPDIKQKIVMTNYLVQVAKALQIEKPKVAIIGASEQVSPAIESSVHATIISKMGDRGQIPGAIIEGPLALDLAVDKESAVIKKLDSVVAGDADCMLFPNIEAANVF
jgi:phosphate butyryltransferase